MDAQLAAALPALPYVGLADPRAARVAMEELARTLGGPAADPRVEVADRRADGVPVRIYRPRHAPGPVPVLVYLHGGGFCTGGLDTEHARCVGLAAEAGVLVVSVDYRLAPEHPFPAGFEDAYTALCWTAAHAAGLGGDPSRLAVGGGSAGGCLAAGLALRARDEHGPPLAFQLLLYPVLDDRRATASMRAYTAPPLFNRGDVDHMWRHYLGGDAEAPVYAAPARAADLRGLPPAFVLVAEIDPLRDEALDHAVRLVRAGVPTGLLHVPGAYHGFDTVPGAAVGREALEAQYRALRRALDSSPDK
ncbi:alpha/beta hydrolase [Actinomadura flavalba]|uniref:alpha/beta hydrolase n=1 Tax=Actinomadura flavalba TaxID=1120938 RepID=UPI00035F2622|nr:alpha/beta hydrolase [Actinomadura flavalba]